MRFVEDFALTAPRRTADGYLVADVRCARTGIQYYKGSELGRPDLDVVPVYRPETSVFDLSSLKTFGGKPVTDDHPDEPVTSKNWTSVAKGYIGETVARDGEYVRAPIILMDEATIKKVEDGKNQLSMGYHCDLVWKDGTSSNGEPYNAIQGSINVNHIAVVDSARAGSACKIGDAVHPIPYEPQKIYQKTMSEKTILVDGISVVTTEQGAQVIDKLQSQIAKLTTDHKSAIDDRDRQLAAKDAEIDKLKGQVLDEAAIIKKANERSLLVDKARKIAPKADFNEAITADQIRRTAVAAVKDGLEGKSEVYIEVLFDQMIENHKDVPPVQQQVVSAISNRKVPTLFGDRDSETGQADYEKRLSERWKTPVVASN